MSDFISRQAVIDLFPNDTLEWDTNCGYIAPHFVRRMIEELPSADAEPVRHGNWTEHKDYPCIAWRCSECSYFTTMRAYRYCPNCGARMDRERKE